MAQRPLAAMFFPVHVQVSSAYREVVNNLNLQVVTEKWSDLLDQLDKFELEIGSEKYFGGEKICHRQTNSYRYVELDPVFLLHFCLC